MKRPLEDAWIDCPAGELSKWAARRRSQRRARLFGVFSLALLLAVVSQRWWAGGVPSAVHPQEPDYGGIVCSAVRAKIGAYVDGSLEPASAAQIEAHAALCPPCRLLIDAARSQRPPQPAAIGGAADRLAMGPVAASKAHAPLP